MYMTKNQFPMYSCHLSDEEFLHVLSDWKAENIHVYVCWSRITGHDLLLRNGPVSHESLGAEVLKLRAKGGMQSSMEVIRRHLPVSVHQPLQMPKASTV